ncbi:MAG: flotillin family protein [Candidatus Sungiibacteriota bacterium]|uniref:Flotillin family protein n=1 Tax=Candidatus Sungiibacteriota bacterium TaxID=2750080 RepID=A0A7T5RK75_9BACT|nr:MAG: flotillin family protein [Candidatus Sungbacteria bacterium]
MFGSFLIPLLIVFGAFSFFAGLALWAKRFYKIPPDKVAIITGRKRRLGEGKDAKVVGYRLVRGGATFVWPVRETIMYLPLNLITIMVDVSKAFNKDLVPVSVDAVANVKIKGEDTAIANAVECFLTKPNEVESTVKQTLEGHLRSIIGTLTIEELNSDRKAFSQRVTEEAVVDLEKMGIGINSIVIKKISDDQGYLESLGRKRTAEVKRDADIGVAEAEADAKKKTTDAARAAAEIAAENERQIAEAQKKLEVQRATYQAEINKERATAEQAGPRAKAEAEKSVFVAMENAKAAQAGAAADYEKQEAGRREQALVATIIKQADAERQATILEAEGKAVAKVKTADAEKQAAELEAEGKAALVKRAGEAEAEANRAKLLAEADGTKAKLLAEAEGIKAKLLAEAEGKEKLAEALKKLDEAGRMLFIMEKSPEVITAVGEAGGQVARGIFEPLGASLGAIDSINVYDSGGGNGSGKTAVERMTSIIPGIVFDFLAKAKANGLPELASLVTNALQSMNVRVEKDTEEPRPVEGQQ